MQDEETILSTRAAESSIEVERRKLDNQNWALRQHLLYHMFNYTLTPTYFLADQSANITIETTLLFPLAQEPELPPTPPPGPPWLPRGGEGLLGGHGQRLRFAKAGSEQGEARGKVGVDHNANGGAKIWDGSGWSEDSGKDTESSAKKDKIVGARWTRNGVVVGIEGVLEPPPSLGRLINLHRI